MLATKSAGVQKSNFEKLDPHSLVAFRINSFLFCLKNNNNKLVNVYVFTLYRQLCRWGFLLENKEINVAALTAANH